VTKSQGTSITSDGSYSIDGFAKLKITGLGSINTVRRYVQAWGDRPKPAR
jgi:hypothetical protein